MRIINNLANHTFNSQRFMKVGILKRIRPLMHSRSNFNGLFICTRKSYNPCDIGRDNYLHFDLSILNDPGTFSFTIWGKVARKSVTYPATWTRSKLDTPVPWFSRSEPTDDSMQPVCHCAQGIVVEGGHFARVDRAIWEEAIPTLPDRGSAHSDGIEPGWALALQ